MQLSICLETLFTDRPFLARMRAARELGYGAIEFWDWRNKEIPAIAKEAKRLGLTIAAMSGNRRHSLIDPDHRGGLTEEMEEAFEVARELNCHHLMMLSDVLQSDGSAAPAAPLSPEDKFQSMVDSMRALMGRAESAGVTLVLEPLNTALDHPGCFLDGSALGFEVVRRLSTARVRLLYDIYHMSLMGEDVLNEIEKNLEGIGHIHVADMPGRHQPGTGIVDYPAVSRMLRRVGYDGFVGMEFVALGPDAESARAPLRIFL